MIGTALVESGLRDLEQIGGPARGFWQIESETFDDIYGRYLNQHRDLLGAVNAYLSFTRSPWEEICSPLFSCAIARIKYWMDPQPLPDDLEGIARYWKRVYNGPGKGKPERFITLFRQHVSIRM